MLLSLPREIRDLIYDEVLDASSTTAPISPETSGTDSYFVIPVGASEIRAYHPLFVEPGLLATCHQIHEEFSAHISLRHRRPPPCPSSSEDSASMDALFDAPGAISPLGSDAGSDAGSEPGSGTQSPWGFDGSSTSDSSSEVGESSVDEEEDDGVWRARMTSVSGDSGAPVYTFAWTRVPSRRLFQRKDLQRAIRELKIDFRRDEGHAKAMARRRTEEGQGGRRSSVADTAQPLSVIYSTLCRYGPRLDTRGVLGGRGVWIDAVEIKAS